MTEIKEDRLIEDNVEGLDAAAKQDIENLKDKFRPGSTYHEAILRVEGIEKKGPNERCRSIPGTLRRDRSGSRLEEVNLL